MNAERNRPEPMYVVEEGRPAYVLVPIEEYEELVKSSMIKSASDKLQNTPDEAWVDLDVFRLQLAGERIAAARKRAGLTQQQLAKKLHVPQSQISRIERNPDATTVRTLKKIARALNVDTAALV
jgi:ribosome-binding protein aMBF1 (putative translation factor)